LEGLSEGLLDGPEEFQLTGRRLKGQEEIGHLKHRKAARSLASVPIIQVELRAMRPHLQKR
jgi:hypothetical protein